MRIAIHGYGGAGRQSLRFFPLYPLLARVLGLGTRVGADIALLVMANAGALGLGAAVHRLALKESGDDRLARRAATLVALAPPAFVLVMGYSEAFALSLLVGALLALRRRAWWWAAAAGLAYGLSRPVGPLLCLPAFIEAARGLSASARREWAARAAAVAAPAAGTAAFLVWCQRVYGDWYLPYRVQQIEGLRGPTVFPGVTVVRAVRGLAVGHVGVDGHYLWVPVLVVLLVPTVRRWAPSLWAFAAATVVVGLAADRLGSLERYAWSSIVLVLTGAALCRSLRVTRVVFTASGLLLGVYATLAFLGYYVP